MLFVWDRDFAMVTISTIVNDVLDGRILTLPQRTKISVLLNSCDWTDEDMSALLVLVDALSTKKVLARIPE